MSLSVRPVRRKTAGLRPGPIRYGPFARLADRLNGRADGKRGIPAAPVDSGGERARTAHTMRLDQLRSARNDAIFRERQRFLDATVADRDALADARAALTEAEAALADVTHRLAEEGTAPAAEDMVLATGDAATPEHITRYRRSREKSARIDRLRQRRDALQEQARTCRREIDRLEGRLDEGEEVSRAQAMRLVEHTRRRVSTYWYWLTRRHPDGPRILALLHPDTDDLPDWLRHKAGDRAYVGGPS